jgi:Inosine-uridine preferring nucleoside hydrolase
MIKSIFPAIVLIVLLFFRQLPAQVKIIFDTDFGVDADDLGALVMLLNFIDKQECQLLAIMSCNLEQYTVSAIDAVNRFYNHPDIPVATRKGQTSIEDWNYTKPLVDNLDYKLSYNDVPDATILYRRILDQSEDQSITIVTVGPLINIQNLLKSEADSISILDGKELIEKKVKEFVIMGGQFPTGENEWNFDGQMPGVTKYVIENISVPITFSGFELGDKIKTGRIFNTLEKDTPLYIGFMHFSQNAPWIKENFKGEILNNSTFDQTAVLYAVRGGTGLYWDKISDGYCAPDEKGGNRWIKDGTVRDHSYLKLKMPANRIAQQIDSMMLSDF